jgi:transposase
MVVSLSASLVGSSWWARTRLGRRVARRGWWSRCGIWSRSARGSRACAPCRSIPDVAASLGVSAQSLRNWARQAAIDRRERGDGLTSAEREELRELRKRVKRLVQERDILKHATAFFARETETR